MLPYASNATINAGPGDDTLLGGLADGTFFGGPGDDVVDAAAAEGGFIFTPNAIIRGGDGEDYLDVGSNNNDQSSVYGGNGDDTLIGQGAVDLIGGQGNDRIEIDGILLAATGYTMAVSGGDGADTIAVDTYAHSNNPQTNDVTDVSGGSGADVFAYTLYDDDPNDPSSATRPNEPGTYLMGVINDFEPGTDILRIEAAALGDGYTFTGATISLGQTTELRMSFESTGSDPGKTLVVGLGNAIVTWDDVEFVGIDQPETLLII